MEVELENVDYAYGQVVALDQVSFRAAAGAFTCLVGPNGAGKSTAAKLISGILKTSNGRVLRGSEDLPSASPEDIARKGLSMVPEGRHIFTTLTVAENLRLSGGVASAKGKTRADLELEFEKALHRFPILKKRVNQFAGTLSGGEQQQLAISRALLTAPSVLVIDEPSLGLAPKITEQVYQHLLAINRDEGITMLVIEQSANRVLSVADHVIVMRNGRVKLDKARSEISGLPELEEAFFGFDPSKTHELSGQQ